MPADHFKILNLPVLVSWLLENHFLLFPLPVNEEDGSILERNRIAVYKGLIFIITPTGKIKLKGSFHKCFNNGEHNYNDFSIKDLLEVIISFNSLFDINPFLARLNSLEIGVNIRLPFPPQVFIDDLLFYKGALFNVSKSKEKLIATVEFDQYIIKIYDKGRQYNKGNILRFEIKFLKMEKVNKIGIKTLADLIDVDKMKKLTKELLKTFDEIIYYDKSIDLEETNTKEREILEAGDNPRYWTKVRNHDSKNWGKKRKKFMQLVNKYGKYEFYKIRDLIDNKIDELLRVDEEYVRRMTTLLNVDSINKFTQNDQVPKPPKLLDNLIHNTQNDISATQSECVQVSIVRKCLITGLDISMQRRNSKFLGTTGVKYYYHNKSEIYKNMLCPMLSERFKKAELDVQFKEIAHAVRRRSYNNSTTSKHIVRKKIDKIMIPYTLFDNLMLINPVYINIAGYNWCRDRNQNCLK